MSPIATRSYNSKVIIQCYCASGLSIMCTTSSLDLNNFSILNVALRLILLFDSFDSEFLCRGSFSFFTTCHAMTLQPQRSYKIFLRHLS